MKLNQRERNLAVIVLSLVLLVFLINWVIVPAGELIKKTKDEVVRKTILLQRYQLTQGKVKTLDSFLTSHKSALEEVKDKQGLVSRIFSEIEAIADKNQVEIKWAKPQLPVSKLTYNEVELELELAGSFNGIFQFIADIESAASLLKIKELKLSTRPDNNLSCRLTIKKVFF